MNRTQQLEILGKIKDTDIDFSDLPDIDGQLNWRTNQFFKPVKTQITAKLDKDIVLWLKLHGDMTKFLNKICREKMISTRKAG